MVFENLTLVELTLENARIGPSLGEEAAEEAGAGGGRAGLAVGLLLVGAAVAAVAARRYRRDATADEDGGITIEQAAER